jgi:hypothetical protein
MCLVYRMRNTVFSVMYALIAKQQVQWPYLSVCSFVSERVKFIFLILPVTVSCLISANLHIHKDEWELSDFEKLLCTTLQLLRYYLTQNNCNVFKRHSNILLYSEIFRENFDYFPLYKQCVWDQFFELKENKVKSGSLFILWIFKLQNAAAVIWHMWSNKSAFHITWFCTK